VGVVQQASEEADTTKFLEAELSSFHTMTGTSNMAEHPITIKDDKPIKQQYYPKNPKVQGEINAKVDELLQMGYIEHSTSPYSSPIVMVKKGRAKSKSIKDAYPMPRINYILDQLREARYISMLDLKDGHWQIPVGRNATSLRVCGLLTGAGPCDRPQNVAARIYLPG